MENFFFLTTDNIFFENSKRDQSKKKHLFNIILNFDYYFLDFFFRITKHEQYFPMLKIIILFLQN